MPFAVLLVRLWRMKMARALILSFFIFTSEAWATKSKIENLCSSIEIHGVDLKFSKTEKTWLCGDDENEAWQVIPPWQAKIFLQSFLQQRGYHQPQFNIQSDKLIVNIGPRSYLKSWDFTNIPPEFHPEKRRKMKDRPMTPELLDEVESWSKSRLQNLGYACPQSRTEAFPENESMITQLQPGNAYRFPQTQKFSLRGKKESIDLGRYAAFSPGQVYDARLLQLTANRILADEYYLSAFFETQCVDDQNVVLIPRLVPGDPQLITAGVGFNTEVGAIARLRYKHSQMNEAGSSFESKLFLSFREQTFENAFKIYDGDPYEDRTYWSPQLNFKNELETQYESFTVNVGLEWGIVREFEGFSSRFKMGPFYTLTDIKQASGPATFRSVTSNADILLQSHEYEFYMAEPREGWQMSTALQSAYEGLGAAQTFHQLTYQHQMLWNINAWDPPLMVLGWRVKAGSFIMSEPAQFLTAVPDNQRFYLGGDGSLRGFARQQIPVSGTGSATMIYQGFELRAGDVFPFKLQPFVFLDMAWESDRVFTLERTLYYSPGIGLRWPSFIGPIRGSLSQGQTLYAEQDIEPHWQVYLSLGREF